MCEVVPRRCAAVCFFFFESLKKGLSASEEKECSCCCKEAESAAANGGFRGCGFLCGCCGCRGCGDGYGGLRGCVFCCGWLRGCGCLCAGDGCLCGCQRACGWCRCLFDFYGVCGEGVFCCVAGQHDFHLPEGDVFAGVVGGGGSGEAGYEPGVAFGGGDGESADGCMGVGEFPGAGCAVFDDECDFPECVGEVGVKFQGVGVPESFADEDVLGDGEFLSGDDGACGCVFCVKGCVGCAYGEDDAYEEEEKEEWQVPGHLRSALIFRISSKMRERMVSSEGIAEVKAFFTWMGTPSSR